MLNKCPDCGQRQWTKSQCDECARKERLMRMRSQYSETDDLQRNSLFLHDYINNSLSSSDTPSYQGDGGTFGGAGSSASWDSPSSYDSSSSCDSSSDSSSSCDSGSSSSD